MINNEINKEKSKEMFITKSGNEWLQEASAMPDAKMLFENLFAEEEVAILFADTNVGKSILAVQMGVEMARNGYKVGYFDFELTIKQFSKRYSVFDDRTEEYKNFDFPETFNRIELNRDADTENYQKELFEGLETAIEKEKYKVLILDNLTAMMQDDGKDTKLVIKILRKVRDMRSDYKVAILVVAHTPKIIPYNPISINDLAGSKILSNLVDNIFSIGASTQSTKLQSIRYIKQLKVREKKLHEADNVIVCEIVQENSFLHLKMIGFSHEREHLQDKPETEKDRIRKQVIELRKETPTMSAREVATKMGNISHQTVGRIWTEEGLV